MENKKSLDHLFAPKDSSSSSSNSIFESMFSQPSMGHGRDSGIMGSQGGNRKYGNPDNKNQKGQSSGISGKDKNSVYQNDTVEPCYLSSSIYYGGQENYSPRANNPETHHTVGLDCLDNLFFGSYFMKLKKDDGDDDPNESNSKGASRGNWWKCSLYY